MEPRKLRKLWDASAMAAGVLAVGAIATMAFGRPGGPGPGTPTRCRAESMCGAVPPMNGPCGVNEELCCCYIWPSEVYMCACWPPSTCTSPEVGDDCSN